MSGLHGWIAFALAIAVGCAGCSAAARAGPEQLPAHAAGENEPDGEESTIVYGPAFFDRFNPITALDILRRIPGAAQLIGGGGGQQRRGFATNTDQILIDGRRIAGKESTGASRLSRIAASDVARVEVIRNVAPESAASGGGQIINIVLKPGESGGAGKWEAQARRYSNGTAIVGGSVSYRGRVGALDYDGEFAFDPFRSPRTGLEEIFGADGALQERRIEDRLFKQREMTATGELTYGFGADHELRIGGLYGREPSDRRNFEETFEVGPGGDLVLDDREQETVDETETRWEVSADYSRPLGASGSLRALFIRRSETERSDSLEGDVTAGTFVADDREIEEEKSTETILRAAYSRGFSGAHKLEIGLEGAINTLDSALRAFEADGGELVELDIANAAAEIEEDRIEGFFAHDWRAAPRTQVKTSLAVEHSNFIQRDEEVRKRSFTFVKPRIDLRYNAAPETQLRLLFSRDVGQLDFGDFVPSFDQDDDEVDTGNPALRPERSWDFEVEVEHRLAGDVGVLRLKGFYAIFEDLIDFVPVGDDDSAPGNLTGGRKAGIEATASVRLSALGLPGALLSGELTWQDTSVIDPFTGARRPFPGVSDVDYSIALRHDVGATPFSYGMDFEKETAERIFELDELDRETEKGALEIFVEYRLGRRLVVRAAGVDVLDNVQRRFRREFAGSRADGALETEEFRTRTRGPQLRLSLRGQF